MDSPDAPLTVAPPALPKGGGAIHGIGNTLGAIGVTGAATLSVALPISPGRGFHPALALDYSSQSGKSEFGQGWHIAHARIARRTGKGTPTFNDGPASAIPSDELVGPDGEVIVPEVDADGQPVRRTLHEFRGAALAQRYTVVRYFPCVLTGAERIESWRGEDDGEWFWIVHDANGTVHVYGKVTRTHAPATGGASPIGRIAEWWLDESVAVNGEQIRYDYALDDEHDTGDDMAPHRADAVYLQRVRYGNAIASPIPGTLANADPGRNDSSNDIGPWHFELILDYGERDLGLEDTPPYEPQRAWLERADPFSSFAFGFEIRTRRLCHQALMFHRFDELGPAPVLVRRTLLEYESGRVCTPLSAIHEMAYDKHGETTWSAPLECFYRPFQIPGEDTAFTPLPALPGLNDGEDYQLVDLYGEGIAGILYRTPAAWFYREPMRADVDTGGDNIVYGPAQRLEHIPPDHPGVPLRQSLTDLNGDGRLEWLVAQPGFAGYFALDAERRWSAFVPLAAVPTEFLAPGGQFADLVGAGLHDFALIGPNSVRLYPNADGQGFGAPLDVAQDTRLPGLGDGRRELIAFADLLGCGQPQLVCVRHDAVTVWPSLGRGRFGPPRAFAAPAFDAIQFDAGRIRLADLDGSGAADMIYLQRDHAEIYLNDGGNGWRAAREVPWPEGVKYDRLCQVSAADLTGSGCASLVLTVPYMTPRHWRCDFAAQGKPYLLEGTNNNMGLASTTRYRSSAQEWLDEKAERAAGPTQGGAAASAIPFALPVVVERRQLDEITGTELRQHFQYRHGYYDPFERELRGFGLVLQRDAEQPAQDAPPEDGFTAPTFTRTWRFVGHDDFADDGDHPGFDGSDPAALPMGDTLRCRFEAEGNVDVPADDWASWSAPMRRDMARALSGAIRRVEVFGLDDANNAPYTVSQTRYLLRLMQSPNAYAHRSVVRALIAEQRTHHYERAPEDPRCDHHLGLRWDANGSPLHHALVHYARRDAQPLSNPAAATAPTDWQAQWRQDAYDVAQRTAYVTETRAAWIDIDRDDVWRAGMPWRTRTNALAFFENGLAPADVTYEAFVAEDGPLSGGDEREIAGLSETHYVTDDDGEPLPSGLVAYEALAELDAAALRAYDGVIDESTLLAELQAAGYHEMPVFLPDEAATLLAVHRRCATFGPLADFHQMATWRETDTLGETTLGYDAYRCANVRSVAPDGCTTQARLDYVTMLPENIVDPNENTHEARYDGFGRLIATSFHGTERGAPAGFMPLSDYVREITDTDEAIASPQAALQDIGSVWYYSPLSWMGRVDAGVHAMSAWIAGRWVMPGGQVRASARRAAQTMVSTSAASPRAEAVAPGAGAPMYPAMPADVARTLLDAERRPPHALCLLADRYPDDAQRQIRMQITDSDGFARILQEKFRVPAGDAWKVLDDGCLALDPDGLPVVEPADPRWRVSERVEYNNKALAVRVYRPYFASSHRYVRDEALRGTAHYDRHYFDPLGRPAMSVMASGFLTRTTYGPWHTVVEDENDTAHEITGALTAPGAGS
ncbi:hypothetical protein AB870_21965 [Pandoraea faecigallinarum]|nr:SpvB/TcaC N-terminal domain-containing protein [Pandoraea faecigallinarum]AKM33093.3 hypothetical protein AB870_21965 [Pandoraea faecigallinarum]